MPLNIFGPYGPGINPSTTRPSDTGEPGATDTFFAPCSSPTANDGTVVSYRWLNKMLATLRRATRGMGIGDDPASDDLLLEAIKRGATLKNVGDDAGVALYQGQDAAKAHMIRRLLPGSNLTMTLVEGPAGEFAVRFNVVVPGSGPSGNAIRNVGDGADVYKGTATGYEDIRGIKGLGAVLAATNGDNVEVSLPIAAWSLLLRNAGTTGEAAAQTLISLTEETNPAAADVLLLGKSADGALRKVRIDKLPNNAFGYVVASGHFTVNASTGALTSFGNGCSLAKTGNDVRVTFSSALADSYYMIHTHRQGGTYNGLTNIHGPTSISGDCSTSGFTVWMDSGAMYGITFYFTVVKFPGA